MLQVVGVGRCGGGIFGGFYGAKAELDLTKT